MARETAMAFSVGQMTHTGRVREKNEDSFGWFTLAGGELFIVADGMGGYAGGQEASKRTVLSFKDYFESHSGDPEELLQESLLYADKKVQEIGQENPALSSCGSTIVALFVSGGIGYFIHAGDSRLYVFSQGKLRQIGRDHSAVQEMLQAGVISAKEAEKAPKNVITQSLGGNIDISRCVVEKFVIENGSSYLLCSDGLWGSVPEDKLASIFSEAVPASSKVSLMVSAAMDAGGPDNITAQLIEFGEPGNTTAQSIEVSEPVSQTQHLPERKSRRRFIFFCSGVLLALVAVFFCYKWFSEPEIMPENVLAGTEGEKSAKTSAVDKQRDDAVKPSDTSAQTNPADVKTEKGTDAKSSDAGASKNPADGKTEKATDSVKPSDAENKPKPAPDGKNKARKTDKAKISEEKV